MRSTLQSDNIPDAAHNRTFRILLVSRNELIRFSPDNFFEDSEFALTGVDCREEAVPLLPAENFDAVIANIDSNPQEGFLLRAEIRRTYDKLPILFMTPLFNWSGSRLLDQIVDDPHSYCIPENADREFMTAIQSFPTQIVMRDRKRATRPGMIASDVSAFFRRHLHNEAIIIVRCNRQGGAGD